MTNTPLTPTPDEARDSLEAIRTMERAGWRRAVAPRWVNAGHALFTAGVCATFAVEPLKAIYFVWWVVAYAVFRALAARITKSTAREYPPPPGRGVLYWGTSLALLFIVIVSAELRWAYDAPWISIAAGVVSGLWLYFYCEVERQHCLNEAGLGPKS